MHFAKVNLAILIGLVHLSFGTFPAWKAYKKQKLLEYFGKQYNRISSQNLAAARYRQYVVPFLQPVPVPIRHPYPIPIPQPVPVIVPHSLVRNSYQPFIDQNIGEPTFDVNDQHYKMSTGLAMRNIIGFNLTPPDCLEIRALRSNMQRSTSAQEPIHFREIVEASKEYKQVLVNILVRQNVIISNINVVCGPIRKDLFTDQKIDLYFDLGTDPIKDRICPKKCLGSGCKAKNCYFLNAVRTFENYKMISQIPSLPVIFKTCLVLNYKPSTVKVIFVPKR